MGLRYVVLRILMVGVLLNLWPAAHAQLPPDKPIKLIAPFGAGSGTDVSARLLAASLAEAIKRPVFVENKPGALATIGTAAAASAPPDGLTLVATGNTAIAAAPSLFKKLPYDPVNDLAPVYLLATASLALFVAQDAPVKTLDDLISRAKARRGGLSYASGNATGAVAGELLKQLAQIDMIHVPYKNSPQALNDVAGGTVDMMFNDIAGATPLLKAGKLRALAVTSRQRSPRMPDVPSLYEAGYAGYELNNWVGIFAPARTPPETISYLATQIAKVAGGREFKERFERVGLDLVQDSSPEAFSVFVRNEIDRWSKLIRAAGLQPQ